MPSVAIVICTFNHAHFLADALASALAQSRPAQDIVVIDDGSHDNPAEIVSRFAGVRLIRQVNAGPSAARNSGLRTVHCDLVLFLDADDVLMPDALAAAVSCFLANPKCCFVYGAYNRLDQVAVFSSGPHFQPLGDDALAGLLRGNAVGMLATALFDRRRLLDYGGFDPAIRSCEDYDLFIRLARTHPVAAHDTVMAGYRRHDTNVTLNELAMLSGALAVHGRHRPTRSDRFRRQAWREGRRHWRVVYEKAWRALRTYPLRQRPHMAARLMLMAPRETAANLLQAISRQPVVRRWKHRIKRALGRNPVPPVGAVNWGSFARVDPIDSDFGYSRGTPIDRHYIAHFLAANAAAITGRVLEIGDASYSKAYGSAISQQDVLHISGDSSDATIVGDIAQAGILPPASFDCLVVTQTLQFIYDMPAAIAQMRLALRPGGTLLLTVPGISPIDRQEWRDTWFWSLTQQSAQRLFAEAFGAENVEVCVYGNVYAACSFLQGLAVEEVRQDWLMEGDPAFPVTVAVRARAPDAH